MTDTSKSTPPDPRLDGPTPGPVLIPRELFDFLMGAGEIDGTSFGDLNERLPGRFWWRALLRTADASPSVAADLLEALEGILAHFGDREQAPGHSHEVPGVWDSDNHPALAGTRCEWCAQWSKARAAITRARGKDHA